MLDTFKIANVTLQSWCCSLKTLLSSPDKLLEHMDI